MSEMLPHYNFDGLQRQKSLERILGTSNEVDRVCTTNFTNVFHRQEKRTINFVKFRILKRRIADLLAAPVCGRVISSVLRDQIPTNGCTIDTSCAHISATTKAQLFLHTYERTEIRFSVRYLRRDLDVVELGSSIGMVSSLLARRLQPQCRILCVEAHPGLAPVVARNVSRNAPAARFDVIQAAIDYESRCGWSQLMPAAQSYGGRLGEGADGIRIRSTTLSEILCEQGIGQYILVSDIEGAEAGILLDDAQALRNCRQMVIELHTTCFRGKVISSQEMARLIAEQHGFMLLENYGAVYAFDRVKRVEGCLFGMQPPSSLPMIEQHSRIPACDAQY
jgi:FkbM family methyltransferase